MSTSGWSSTRSFTTKASYIPSSEEAILSASDKAASNYFGASVAISADGTRVIVGSPYATVGAYGAAGKAYVFIRSGSSWSQEAIITAGDPQSNDRFGTSVAIASDGSRAIISAPYKNNTYTSVGQVYVYTRSGSTWNTEAYFVAADRAAQDRLGIDIDCDDACSRIIAGTYAATSGGITGAGKAYIFTRSGTSWYQEAMIYPTDRESYGYFGFKVSIAGDGTRCICGHLYGNVGGLTDAGKAVIFSRSGSSWTQEAILSASDAANNGRFGSDVSIGSTGTRVAIGAYTMGAGGRAYIFVRSGTTWTQETPIVYASTQSADEYGGYISISRDGTKIVVGAPMANPGGINNAGAAYLWSRSGTSWSHTATLSASNKLADDSFGSSVEIDETGSRIVIGSPNADPGSFGNAGAAYIFS